MFEKHDGLGRPARNKGASSVAGAWSSAGRRAGTTAKSDSDVIGFRVCGSHAYSKDALAGVSFQTSTQNSWQPQYNVLGHGKAEQLQGFPSSGADVGASPPDGLA